MEGVYSLSQLMGLANHSFFNPAHRTSRYSFQLVPRISVLYSSLLQSVTKSIENVLFFRPVLQTLNLITTIISNIEVFAEGVSTMFGSIQQRNLLVGPLSECFPCKIFLNILYLL